jgi:pimeloyl-ACP methyl ester carboxylesterase
LRRLGFFRPPPAPTRYDGRIDLETEIQAMSEDPAVAMLASSAHEPEGATACPPRRRRFIQRGVFLLTLVALGFIAVLYTLQANIIFPGAATQGTPEAVARPRAGEDLVRLRTSGGDEVVALYGPALLADGRAHPDPASRPALVYFYGNAMCLAYSTAELQRFRRLGLKVIIPDYLGYGMSGGKPSEAGCRETAEACYRNLLARGFQSDRIFVGGWSLGGAVAIDLASREPVAGLFAFSTFTSIPAMSRSVLPIPLPGALFKHKFDSLGKVPKLTCPVLLGHGRADPLVPFAMFESLAAAIKAPLTRLVVDGAEHNDFYEVGGRRIDEAVKKLAATVD